MLYLNKIIKIISSSFRKPYYGFIQGHDYIKEHDIKYIKRFLERPSKKVVDEFEKRFASIVGDGQAVSFASGRMGFYALMKVLGIGPGDEIILQGSTCVVMVNSILRTGATPVFADIDPETFGSSAEQIEKCITPKTKMVVAQHSFGIPCKIDNIAELCKEKNIFLLEDSALAVGSTFNGEKVGNFGDAALFSTDHSKPINTIIGGLIYTKNSYLANRLKEIKDECLELPEWKQRALWTQFLIERKFCNPQKYGYMGIIEARRALSFKLFKNNQPFLTDEHGSKMESVYPYPAKLPSFLAAIGLYEIERWPEISIQRKEIFRDLLDITTKSYVGNFLPRAYFDPRLDIIPLRFVWSQPNGSVMRKLLSHVVHVDWTWFLLPIIAASEPLECLGYKGGYCPISESIGKNMVNMPCNIYKKDLPLLINGLKKVIKQRAI